MRAIFVWSLRGMFTVMFSALGIAAFHLYSPLGALFFLMVIASVFMFLLHLVHSSFRKLDRTRFMHTYRNYAK